MRHAWVLCLAALSPGCYLTAGTSWLRSPSSPPQSARIQEWERLPDGRTLVLVAVERSDGRGRRESWAVIPAPAAGQFEGWPEGSCPSAEPSASVHPWGRPSSCGFPFPLAQVARHPTHGSVGWPEGPRVAFELLVDEPPLVLETLSWALFPPALAIDLISFPLQLGVWWLLV